MGCPMRPWVQILALTVIFLVGTPLVFKTVYHHEIQVAEARHLYKMKDFAGASEILAEVVERYPKNLQYLMLYGECLYLSRQYERAAQVLEVLHKACPNDSQVARMLADARMCRGDFPRAIEILEEVLMLAPGDLDLRLKLARAACWAKQYERSMRAYQHYLSRRPHDIPVLREFAAVLGWAGQPAEAVKVYRNLLSQAPEDPALLEGLSEQLAVLGNYNEALTWLLKLASLRPTDMPLALKVARLATKAQNYAVAVSYYERVLNAQPTARTERFEYAYVLLATKQFHKAEAQFRSLLVELCDEPALQGLAETAYQRGDYPKALQRYQDLVKFAPNNVDARIRLAELSALQKQYDISIAEYQRLAAEKKLTHKQLRHFAQVLLQADKPQEAIAVFDDVLAFDPKDAEALRGLATALGRLSRYKEQASALEGLQRLNPLDLGVKLEIARAWSAAKQFDKAIPYYQQVLAKESAASDLHLEFARVLVAAQRFKEAEEVYRKVMEAKAKK